jgi:uncharacterized membrane protein
MSLDLAVLVFRHTSGADYAYANVHDAVGDADWMRKLAFAEHHRRDRMVVRGTVAGRYVDVDGEGDVTGSDAVHGAEAGAAAGALLGPPGFAAGMVAGAAIGGLEQARSVPEFHSALVDELRTEVPKGGSAVVLLADPAAVQTMIAAFTEEKGTLVRHHLSDEASQVLEDSVRDAPPAA